MFVLNFIKSLIINYSHNIMVAFKTIRSELNVKLIILKDAQWKVHNHMTDIKLV